MFVVCSRTPDAQEAPNAIHGDGQGQRRLRGGRPAQHRDAHRDGQVQRGARQGRRACWPARGCTRARRARGSGSPAPSAPSSTGRSPRRRSSSPASGSWQVKSKDEAIEWVKRCPNPTGEESEIEIRQVFETEDFGRPADARAARAGRAPARARPRRAAERRCRRSDAHRAIDAVWRIESARLIAGLARIVRDVGARRGARAGRARRRARAVARVGRPGQPGRLAHGHREAPRDRRAAPRHDARAQARGARPRARGRSRRRRRSSTPRSTTTSATTCCGWSSRPAIPVLSHRGARRAHAAPARRPHHRGDRARVPRARADGRPAHRPRQADARRGAACRSRCPRGRASPRGWPRCSR